jgi:nucleotide-binding universal stress UspA family protein
MSTKVGKVWLVAVDGSKHAEQAFHAALDRLDPKVDTLYIMGVVQVNNQMIRNLIPGAEQATKQMTDVFRKILREYTLSARQLGLQYINPILSVSSHVGAVICQAAEQHHVDTIAVGTRGLGGLRSVIFGSTSRYVVENAACDVLIVKTDMFPGELHDLKRVAVLSEEAERLRRLNEITEAEVASNSDRTAAWIGSVRDEEAERKARMKAGKETAEHVSKQYSVLLEEGERLRRLETDQAPEKAAAASLLEAGRGVKSELDRKKLEELDTIVVHQLELNEERAWKTVF